MVGRYLAGYIGATVSAGSDLADFRLKLCEVFMPCKIASLKICKLKLPLTCFKWFYFVCLRFRFVYEMSLSRICLCLGFVRV